MNNEAIVEMAEKVDGHDKVLFGREGEPGLAHKVGFMWRIHVWILCTLSGLVGALLVSIAHKLGFTI